MMEVSNLIDKKVDILDSGRELFHSKASKIPKLLTYQRWLGFL
jgi:hypothetical protein